MSQCKCNDSEQAILCEIVVQLRSRLSLDAFRDSAAILDKQHSLLLARRLFVARSEYAEELSKELVIRLEKVDDVDLVKEDEGV